MPDIVIKEQEVREWRHRLDQLRKQIRERQEEYDVIAQKLDALRFFAGERDDSSDPFGSNPFDELKPPDAVIVTLGNANAWLTPKQIKMKLHAVGYPMERLGKNGVYLYNVLRRLVDSERAAKRGNKYKVKEERREPENETA